MKKQLPATAIFIGCILSGFYFYKMNPGDTINSVFFALGLMGIGLSFLRNRG